LALAAMPHLSPLFRLFVAAACFPIFFRFVIPPTVLSVLWRLVVTPTRLLSFCRFLVALNRRSTQLPQMFLSMFGGAGLRTRGRIEKLPAHHTLSGPRFVLLSAVAFPIARCRFLSLL